MWRPLADKLAPRRRLIMFDAPGTGESTAPGRPIRMRGYAHLVIELLDALHINKTDVLGYSWGGAVAQQLAHDAPTRIRRVVLAATTPGIGGRPPKAVSSLGAMMPSRKLSTNDVRATGLGSWLRHPPSCRGYAYQALANSLWSSVPWLHQITAPVLVIQGGDDPFVTMHNGRVLHRLIPRSTLQVVPGGDHLWLLKHPDKAARRIDRFLG
jgi:pimeloyl-ACP methyl ester carboxylesterase